MSQAHPPVLIVDENDNPIGEEDLRVAQQQGHIVRIARVMVEDDSGRILLQKRSTNMRVYPNCWDNSAAGHVDVGEDYLGAAKREMQEEVGITGKELTEIGAYFTDEQYEDLRLRRFNKVYKTKATDKDITIDPSEVSEVKWFSLDEIKDLVKNHPEQVTDGVIDVIERCYA